ncbi:MAG: efflux RND transporter periplasmic adaptor subunit [Anaerolineae bacterium]
MSRSKRMWMVLLILAVLGGGGYGAYRLWFSPEGGGEAEVEMQTATVTRGDLTVTAAGSGQLVPASEVELTFDASGKVLDILVEVGDKVEAEDVLAWIDDSNARQAVAAAEIQVMAAEQDLAVAVAEAELTLAQAEADLTVAQRELDEMENWEPDEDEISIAKASLLSAQVSYQTTSAKASLTDASNTSTRISLDQAIAALEDAQQAYAEAMNPERDWEKNIDATRENAADSLVKAQQNLEIAQANYDLMMVESTPANNSADLQSAWAQVLNAEAALEEVETPPDDEELATARVNVQKAEIALERAKLSLGDDQEAAMREAELALEQANSALDSAQEALNGTALTAPFAGTITAVNIEVGGTAIEDATAIVMADLDNPVVQFWVEETDLGSVGLGNPVDIVFTALPDLIYPGEIYQIDPVLVSVSSTPAVQCWSTIDISANPVTLLGDMNVDVDIVAGEATNALLVPVQALREVGGQEAVFVVLPSGELEMRIVEVGLQDYVNAAVLSGLEAGEVVSLGESTSAVSTEMEELPAVPGGDGMMMGGGGRP